MVISPSIVNRGSVLEADLIPGLEAALGRGVDIFHLCISCMSRHDFPLIAFREWLGQLRRYGRGTGRPVRSGQPGE